jgi:hypothetical protein
VAFDERGGDSRLVNLFRRPGERVTVEQYRAGPQAVGDAAGLVHLRFVARPPRLDVGGGADGGEPRHVPRVHDLQVGEVVLVAELTVGGQRRLDGAASPGPWPLRALGWK